MGMAWMWFFWPLLLVAVVILLALSTRSHGVSGRRGDGAPSNTNRRPSARDILDRRYASGELSTEEYRERLAALRNEAE